MKVLINHEIAERFSAITGIEAVSLYPYKKLDFPVQCHADMLFCVLDNIIFCYEDYVTEYDLYDTLAGSGKEVRFVSAVCGSKYPSDIALNVLVMGDTIFCNISYTAKEVLEYARERGYKIVNVRQGYAACSTLVICEDLAITADKGVCDAIKKQGKECLLIYPDEVVLDGYNCGFCGGASGKIDNTVYFFGDISLMKSAGVITQIAKDKNFELFQISSGRVNDFGGFKVI